MHFFLLPSQNFLLLNLNLIMTYMIIKRCHIRPWFAICYINKAKTKYSKCHQNTFNTFFFFNTNSFIDSNIKTFWSLLDITLLCCITPFLNFFFITSPSLLFFILFHHLQHTGTHLVRLNSCKSVFLLTWNFEHKSNNLLWSTNI